MTVSNPSLSDYKQLLGLHSNTLKCPCLNVMISYNKFMSLSATLHQVCSSDYVSESWISLVLYLGTTLLGKPIYHWPGLTDIHFRLLSTLCKLANNTIADGITRFEIQSLVTSNVLTKFDFDAQLNTTYNQFIQSLITDFDLLLDIIHLFIQVDQPFTLSDNAKVLLNDRINGDNDQPPYHFKFNLTGVKNINSTSFDCICATDPHCQIVVNTSPMRFAADGKVTYIIPYTVPGAVKGCFTSDTLLLSTLECYYLDSCISAQYTLINVAISLDVDVEWFQIKPLNYDRNSTRFFPNTSLAIIIKEMMIERWNLSSSFKHYYEACAPIYCTYSYTAHTTNFIGIIIQLISTIGGLTAILRVITPLLVKVVFSLIKLKTRRQHRDNRNLFDRIKTILRNLITLLYTILINLNIFPIQTFGITIDRTKATILGKWAARLYIVLLSISFTILSLYTAVQEQVLTNTFVKPSLTTYNDLLLKHIDTLQCPCSSISSRYNQFIDIVPVFHQICSSPFITVDWRINMTKNLFPDLSIYNIKDYRRFLSAHLQFLSGLCTFSIQSVRDSVDQFLSSFFITAQLLSPSIFRTQINLLIEYSKLNAPAKFNRLLFLIRAINHGNAIITAYGTNFEYIAPGNNNFSGINAITQSLIYDNECSCGLTSNCTTQASFIEPNFTENLSIMGLRMGCTPTESFFLSTLECFYNLSCINLIEQFTNNININNYVNDIPLSYSLHISRFPMNTTISNLVKELFIENWTTTIDYSAYFDLCSPTLCSYTYVEQFNLLYTITVLLSLYGGLTFVLHWICPRIVYLIAKIYQYWKRRKNIIEPISNAEMTNTVISTTNVHNTTVDPISQTKLFSTLMRWFIFGFILIILMIVAMIIASFYFNREINNSALLAVLSMNTTITTTIITGISTTTVSTSTEFTCQLTFQPIVSYATDNNPQSIAINDFNNDRYLDIVILNSHSMNVGVLLGNGDGTFQAQITYLTNGINPVSIVVADFDLDGCSDIVVTNLASHNIGILFGNGDGTFQTAVVFSTGFNSLPSSIAIGDFNDDNCLDLAIVNSFPQNILVLLGSNDRTFQFSTTFRTGTLGSWSTLATGDFNNDGRLDLAASAGNTEGRVGILLNINNEDFAVPTIYSTGLHNYPNSIAVNDFNNDNQLDLATANTDKSNIGIMFGNGDGTFEEQILLSTGTYSGPFSIAVGDFNNDGEQDLAVSNSNAHNVGILLGIGNGTFLTQITFSTGINSIPKSIASGDFNNDGKLDIVVTDVDSDSVGILLNTCDCCISK